MEIKPLGDCALMVKLEQEISVSINSKAKSLKKSIDSIEKKGIIETVITYCTVTVYYDPKYMKYDELCHLIRQLYEKLNLNMEEKGRKIVIPVLYGGKYGQDMEEVAKFEGKSVEECIKLHTNIEGYVYMLGNMPGNAYIGSNQESFHKPRKDTSGTDIPDGSVIIQSGQTIILPHSQPTGWNWIGLCPLKIVDYTKENPFLFMPGDSVRFRSIDKAEFDEIKQKVDKGIYQLEGGLA